MIDWAQVKQLEEDVGAEDLTEVIDVFLEEVDEAVASLRTSAPQVDDDISATLHFLKGSAYNLGFKSFGDYCGEGEKLANNGNGTFVDFQKVISLYDNSRAQFIQEAAQNCAYDPATV